MWSVPWRDRLQAFVAPDHVDIVGTRRAPPWAPAPPVALRIERPADDASLADCLASESARLPCRGAPVRVVLSNHYVRYAPLALGGRLVTTEEREIAARFALRETFHELADGWKVSLGDTGPDTAIAAGVAPEVITEIVTGFTAIGSRVAAIEPALVRCVNALPAEARAAGSCWLACQEPTRLVLARLEGGGIRTLRSLRARPGETPAWQRLLEQARLSEGLGDEDSPVFVYRIGMGASDSSAATDWLLSPVAFEAAARRAPGQEQPA